MKMFKTKSRTIGLNSISFQQSDPGNGGGGSAGG
ncbi:hypothetical protein L8106_22436 [Lyngbya sp. PCC 8106]|nr:hypothetical protein L8106_22436 [Lyngbya sp. PCC 8106]